MEPPVRLFLVLTFSLSWGVSLLAWSVGITEHRSGLQGTGMAFMMGPAIAAFVCTLLYDRGARLSALGLAGWPSVRWMAAAAALPFVAIGLAMVVAVGMTDLVFQPNESILGPNAMAYGPETAAGFPWLGVTMFLVFLGTWILIRAAPQIPWYLISEEIGWRGWLYGRWRHFGFWPCAAAIGLVWGVWHAPLVLIGLISPGGGLPWVGVPLMVLSCLSLTPVIHLVRERGGSVIHAAVFHAVFNGAAPLPRLFIAAPEDPWSRLGGPGGLGGIAAFGVMSAGVALYRYLVPAPTIDERPA